MIVASICEEKKSKKGHPVTSLIERLVTYMGLASSGIVMVILFFIVIEVLSRAAFNKPIQGVVEINGFLLVMVVFLGIAYVQLRKGHIRADFIISRFPPRLQSLHFMFTSIIFLTVFSVIGYFGAKKTIQAYLIGEFDMGTPWLPTGIIRMFVPIGAFLVDLLVASELVQEIRKFIRSPHQNHNAQ